MDDLISRQAAIDALNEVSEHYTDKGREWHPHVNFMVEAIGALPSAQPEITLEEVKEYCRKRGYVLLTSEVFYSLKQEYQRGKKRWLHAGIS